MRSSERAFRIGTTALAILLGMETLLRFVTLYPYVPGQRFHNLWSTTGLAPNARQIREAVDHVRANAKPGDWVLLGDSVLNGTHVPRANTPAAVLRARLHDLAPSARVWDLCIVGADPAMYAAILDRLGPLEGATLATNVSVKLVAHPNFDEIYFAQLWDEMAHWSGIAPESRDLLSELSATWIKQYGKSEHPEYGDNSAEAWATVWLNTHVALLGLDHWFRFHFSAEPWTRLLPNLVRNGTSAQFWPAKDYDVIWREWPHEPLEKVAQKSEKIREWFGRAPERDEPLWRAFLLYLDRVKSRGKLGIVSLHTVSPHHARFLPTDVRQGVENAYAILRAAIAERGISLVEPGGLIPAEEYTDADHFGVAGNRRWTETILGAAGIAR